MFFLAYLCKLPIIFEVGFQCHHWFTKWFRLLMLLPLYTRVDQSIWPCGLKKLTSFILVMAAPGFILSSSLFFSPMNSGRVRQQSLVNKFFSAPPHYNPNQCTSHSLIQCLDVQSGLPTCDGWTTCERYCFHEALTNGNCNRLVICWVWCVGFDTLMFRSWKRACILQAWAGVDDFLTPCFKVPYPQGLLQRSWAINNCVRNTNFIKYHMTAEWGVMIANGSCRQGTWRRRWRRGGRKKVGGGGREEDKEEVK